MIPTDETRHKPKRPVLAPPSLADDANLKWEIQELNLRMQECKVRVQTGKQQKVGADGKPAKLDPPSDY